MLLGRASIFAALLSCLSCDHGTHARDASLDVGVADRGPGGSDAQDARTTTDSARDLPTVESLIDTSIDTSIAIDGVADAQIDVCCVDGDSTSKAALLDRLCWGDGLATSLTLAGPDASISTQCGVSSPCQFPIVLDLVCMPGEGAYCIRTLAYVPPSELKGQPTCAQCPADSSARGTALAITIRIPQLDANPLACPPNASSTETRVLALSADGKAVYRVTGTDQMATVLSITEVDRNLYAAWAK